VLPCAHIDQPKPRIDGVRSLRIADASASNMQLLALVVVMQLLSAIAERREHLETAMGSHRLAKSQTIRNLEITVRILKLRHTHID